MGGGTLNPSFVLHLAPGASFVITVVDTYGVQAFNRWNDSIAKMIPGVFSEEEPALCFWFTFDDADLTHKRWNQIDLGLASCKGTRFDHSSLVGAEIGYCPSASFRSCDLRNASLCGDLSDVDFSDAITDGIKLEDCTYEEGHPPIALPEQLLQQCRPVPVGEPGGAGVTEYPVPITASLAKAWVPQ